MTHLKVSNPVLQTLPVTYLEAFINELYFI